mmetsp:Transcript_15461/g.33625  ORF Transcript_15461/g.33625 Transcript_15461/m.33625 type:complete len:248 (+) Transcript_15461:84-827(+)
MASFVIRRVLTSCSRQAITAQEISRLSQPTARAMHPSVSQLQNMPYFTSSLLLNSRSFSSEAERKGVFDRIKDKFDSSSEENQKEKYAEQLKRMADSNVWTLGMFADEMNNAMSGWRQYIPGMSKVKQVQQVKQAQKTVNAIKDQLGGDATAKTLVKLTKVQKLNVCLEADVDPDELDALIGQFKAMETMHRILRYRKEHGKTIPHDEETMKLAVQMDSAHVLTKQEKKEMQARHAQSMGMVSRSRP